MKKKTKTQPNQQSEYNIRAEGDVAAGGSTIDKRTGSLFVENAQIKGNIQGNIDTNQQEAQGEMVGFNAAPTPNAISSSTSSSSQTTSVIIVRVLTLVIGVLGIVGSIIWLLRNTPESAFQYLIPLVVIVIAAVLGAMGLLAPDQIVRVLLGSRIESPELVSPTEDAKPLKDNEP